MFFLFSLIYIDFIDIYWKLKCAFFFLFLVVPSQSCKPREINPRKEPRIRPQNGNWNYCSPGCSMISLNYSTDCFTSRFTVLTRKYSFDVAKVGWQDLLGDGQAGIFHFKLWMFHRVLRSSWKRKTLPRSPSFTLKGQWWYTLTTQEIEISQSWQRVCLRPRRTS